MRTNKTAIWIGMVLAFSILLGYAIMAQAEEQIVNGTANVALIFEVYGASSGDPCLVEADITAWNLQYYRDGAANKDVNNATLATLGTHVNNKIACLGAGKWWACFPDTCFDGGVNTKVTCWLTHDANEFICPAITVVLTPADYNSVSGVRNGDVMYVRGGTPIGDDRFDDIDASFVTVKADQVTAQGNITDILADTDMLQDDWVDGGRLDVILDAVPILSQIGDKVVADMDANSLLVNWTAGRAAIITDLAGISEIGDKIVADMDANSTLSGGASLSAIGDKVVADMDANSLLVNWTALRAAIITDLAGISEIGDKVVADMDANSLLVNWTALRAAIISDLAGISEIGDKVVADMDANSLLANGTYGLSALKTFTAPAATALSTATWTNTKAGYLDMKISDVNAAAGGAGATDLLSTTVAAGSSTTQFTLTDGPDGNDAYINHTIVVTDANASSYPEARKVVSYIGATKTVIVDLPFSFTPAAGDDVAIPKGGYAPSGAGWGMLDPRNVFEILFAKEPQITRTHGPMGIDTDPRSHGD